MNGQTIFSLFLDGAYHQDSKLFHPSFRKGWRKVTSGNISLQAAEKMLRKAGRLQSGIEGEFFTIRATASEGAHA